MRVAVLGLGSAGARHARHLGALGHEVVGFDPAGAGGVGIRTSESEEEATAGCDAVVVATPNALHAGQALSAIEAGRSVLVEKPLGVTAEEARAVADAAASAGVACGVAVNLRFHPALRLLRELVRSGELGEPLVAHAWFGHDLREWRPGTDWRSRYSARADLGGGVVLDAIHELDYLLWLLGPAREVSGVAATVGELDIDVEDVAAAAVRFESGARGVVDLNYLDEGYRRGCELAGPVGSARWDWNEAVVSVSRDGAEPERRDVACDLDDTYRAVVADFVDAVETGRDPICPAAEGAAAVALAEAVKTSNGRTVLL